MYRRNIGSAGCKLIYIVVCFDDDDDMIGLGSDRWKKGGEGVARPSRESRQSDGDDSVCATDSNLHSSRFIAAFPAFSFSSILPHPSSSSTESQARTARTVRAQYRTHRVVDTSIFPSKNQDKTSLLMGLLACEQTKRSDHSGAPAPRQLSLPLAPSLSKPPRQSHQRQHFAKARHSRFSIISVWGMS